jgi:hypothetical protein
LSEHSPPRPLAGFRRASAAFFLTLLVSIWPAACGGPLSPVPGAAVPADATDQGGAAGSVNASGEVALSTTDADLAIFWGLYGGRNAFPPSYVNAVEALLRAEDEVVAGDHAAARARIDALFRAYPLSDPVWWTGAGRDGANVGRPVAYYGLRMLDEIATVGLGKPAAEKATIVMTVVEVACADGHRPTRVDLSAAEAVHLRLDPGLSADDHFVVRQALRLFERYVTAISGGGLRPDVRFHRVEKCARVGYSSPPNRTGLLDYAEPLREVPATIAETTDMWWVIYPSNVPGDPIFNQSEFITGGMGASGAAPVFISDDLWLLRKPPHLGFGPYTAVERRVYLPQWLQHEFFHHLFRTYRSLGLEASPHQWFDRKTWPPDFGGAWEPDYYAEALRKRLYGASPSLFWALRAAPASLDLSGLSTASFLGAYTRRPVENGWHQVTITVDGNGALWWENAASRRWSLTWAQGALRTGPDCPYGAQRLGIEPRRDVNGAPLSEVAALLFNGGRYER